jgi:hypothetical protein
MLHGSSGNSHRSVSIFISFSRCILSTFYSIHPLFVIFILHIYIGNVIFINKTKYLSMYSRCVEEGGTFRITVVLNFENSFK